MYSLERNNNYEKNHKSCLFNCSYRRYAWNSSSFFGFCDESIPDVIKCSELANLYEISLDELVHDKISVEEESTNSEDGKYVFGIVKVGERGQIVIPKHARDVFDIKPGDKLLVVGDIKRGLGIGKVSRSIASDFVFEE